MVLKDGSILTIKANIVAQIAESIQRRPVNLKSLDNWEYLWNEFSLADNSPSEKETSSMELLVGNNYYLDLILPQKEEVQPDLCMLGPKLGWIFARTNIWKQWRYSRINHVLTNSWKSDIHRHYISDQRGQISSYTSKHRRHLKLDSIGINNSPVESYNDVALERFNETLKYEQGRYTVKWPWKEESPDLPENRALALRRLKALVNRMKNNPDLIQKYDKAIADQLNKGIIERVNSAPDSLIKLYIPIMPTLIQQRALQRSE